MKVSLYDHVLYRCHCNFEKISVGSIGEMAVDFTSRASIQGNKLVHEIFRGLLPTGSVSLEIGEAELGNWAVTKLCFEQIDLVQKEDQRGMFKPMRVCN